MAGYFDELGDALGCMVISVLLVAVGMAFAIGLVAGWVIWG